MEAPATLIFDYPSVSALADWLVRQLPSSTAAAAATSQALAVSAPIQALPAGAAPVAAVAGTAATFPSVNGDTAGAAGFWQQAASGCDVQGVVPLAKWDTGKRRGRVNPFAIQLLQNPG